MIMHKQLDQNRGKVYHIAGIPDYPGMRDGEISSVLFNSPSSLVYYANDTVEKLYVADTNNNCIRELDLSSGEVWEFVGNCQELGFKDGPYGINRLNKPTLIGIDSNSKMFVLDSGNKYIRIVDLDTRYMRTLYGGACKTITEDEKTKYNSLPSSPYIISNFLNLNLKINEMICVTTMIKITGEPSEHIYDESKVEISCLSHDILCQDRDHPLVSKF